MNGPNFKPLISATLCSLVLAACQPHKESTTLNEPTSKPAQSPMPANVESQPKVEIITENPVDNNEASAIPKEFSFSIVKEQAANTYTVKVKSNTENYSYEVYRSLQEKEQGELLKDFEASVDSFVENADSRTYADKYVYYTVVIDRVAVSRARFHIKADLVVSGDFYIRNNLPNTSYNLASLVLKDRARLFVETSKVVFKTDLFQSENAEIISFNTHAGIANTSNGKDASPAGRISIDAVVVRGNLKVDLRGANGVKGDIGLASTQQGPKGQVGVAETTSVFRDCTPSVLRSGGPMMRRGCSDTLQCGTPASSGSKGLPGGEGGLGQPGGSAGQGGTFVLRATEADLFSLDYDTSAGVAGEGGDGGAGGPGGQGGDPGPRGKHCPYKASAGPVGDQGPSGNQGPRGDHGLHGTVDVEIKSLKLKVSDVKGRI